MESFPLFFRIRAITFIVIMLFSFLWLALLSVEAFARWTMSDQISQSLIILFILTNTTTLILLPILILVEFRIWLDAARLFFLFVLQVGSAGAGTRWSPKIQCPDRSPDDIGVCQLIAVYTTIASWIIPVMLLLYSTYFAAVVYLQSRIPVVVEPKRRPSVDREMGSNDLNSLSLWRKMLQEVVKVKSPSTDTSISPRPLVLPTMVHTGQSSLARSSTQGQSILLNTPHRQSTMPSLPHASNQQFIPAPRSVPNRHRSLPLFQHGNEPRIPPLLTLPIPHALATNASSSLPQTPSSRSYSTPSSANHQSQTFTFGPGVADVRSPVDNRWRSKHLSMMPPCSSPVEIQSTQGSPTTRSTRAKLSKPIPVHLL